MIIGVPRETKEGERRIALLPLAVEEITEAGHDVRVETGAGKGIGIEDQAYRDAGADITLARDVWTSDLIVKVKEVQDADLAMMADGATIFSYQHLTGAPARVRTLAGRHASVIAWEFVRDLRGRFPLLAPMSRIAGRVAIDMGIRHLRQKPAKVLVLGAGVSSMESARCARKAGMEVIQLARTARGDIGAATPAAVERHALEADLVVAAVFNAGAPTPKLLPRSVVRRMKRGAMIVDVSIEEGGVAETSRRTTHAEPTYVDEGVIHYCVGNIPAAYPVEASTAISEAVLPYVLDIASHETVASGLLASDELRQAVLMWQGRVTRADLAAEAGLPYSDLTDAVLEEST